MTDHIPSWAVPGAKCVSLNSDWFDYVAREHCSGPQEGELVTITGVTEFVAWYGSEPNIALCGPKVRYER